MRCNNCGASVKTIYCDYCGSFLGSKTEAVKKISAQAEKIEEILQKIKYFESSHAPESVKNRKIELLNNELSNLGYKK